MSTHRSKRPRRPGHRGGAIQRMIDRLSDSFGVSRRAVIVLLLVGIIVAPLLTLPALFAVWYSNERPEQHRNPGEPISARARRAARQVSDAVLGRTRPATAPDFDLDEDELAQAPPTRPRTAADLRQRFEALDQRAKRIEEVVASEEFRLEREFRRIDD